MQPYSKREEFPGLTFSLTSPCLPAVVGAGNSSEFKIRDPKGRKSLQWAEKAWSRELADRCVPRARKCPPTSTKHFWVPALSWPDPEASRASWVYVTMHRAGEVPLILSSWWQSRSILLVHLASSNLGTLWLPPATEQGCCLQSTVEEQAYGRPQCPLEVEKYFLIWWQRRTGGLLEGGLLHHGRRDCSRLARVEDHWWAQERQSGIASHYLAPSHGTAPPHNGSGQNSLTQTT